MATLSRQSHRPDRADTQDELDRLWMSEFGDRNELVLRYALIGGASVAAFLYAGATFALVWGVLYFATQWVTHTTLKRLALAPASMPIAIGIAAYLLTTLTFVSMPLGLFVFGDRALSYCGAMALLCLCAFSLWRAEPPRLLLYYDIALAWLFAGAAAFVAAGLSDVRLAQAMMILLTGAGAVYYTLALMTTRRNRGILRSASTRATEAQKMEAIGRLSGGLAHDFNNILTVVQGNLELYEEIEDEAERRKLVTEALVASRRAAGLVGQLLTFARRAPLEPARIDVIGVVDELTNMTTRLLPATVKVFAAKPVAPIHVRADRNQLLSALLNLVINARDAMDNKGELTITAGEASVTEKRPIEGLAAGRYVRFAISDTGPGIPAEVLDRVFEPFFTTKPVGGGSGLGLSSARGFAEQSGGTLTIETSPSGTVATIFLPRPEANAV